MTCAVSNASSAHRKATLSQGLASGPLDEVKWQVAWWALVPLAIGDIVLHYRARLEDPSRTQRKVAPKFEVRDTTPVPGQTRYETSRMAESTVLLCWTLLLFGGIPGQTMKVVTMSGIALTKTWGLMYFISIAFAEVLIILGRQVEQPAGDEVIPLWRQGAATSPSSDVSVSSGRVSLRSRVLRRHLAG